MRAWGRVLIERAGDEARKDLAVSREEPEPEEQDLEAQDAKLLRPA